MKRNQQDVVRISDEAASWVVRLESDESARTQAEFDTWLRQGPSRFDEFWKAQTAWDCLNKLDASYTLGSPEQEDRIVHFPGSKSDASGAEQVAPFQGNAGATSISGRRRHFAWSTALAATVLLTIGAIVLLPTLPFGSQVYATSVGSQQAIKLSDGSIIRLNTHSRVKVRYSEHLREIRLADGEAFFTVAHDPARPFVVITDSARVRAVGTQFNVYRAEQGATRVAVLDGVVQVTTAENNASDSFLAKPSASAAPSTEQKSNTSSNDGSGEPAVIRLAAGDEAVVRKGQVRRADSPDVKRAVAWQERQLVFTGNRIADIAEQFNRYNTVQIRVEGAIAERRMGGTFDVDDPTPMIRYLSHDPSVEVIKTDTQILIRPRESSETRN